MGNQTTGLGKPGTKTVRGVERNEPLGTQYANFLDKAGNKVNPGVDVVSPRSKLGMTTQQLTGSVKKSLFKK